MELFFRKPIRKLICYIKIIKKYAKEVFQIYYYIYLTENLVTGRKYIGKRKCKCKTDEDTYLGSGKILKQAIAKYGTQNFKKTIIEVCSSEEECNNREKFWIGKFDAASNPDFYNIALGGDGGNTYAGLSSEELIKIRQIKSEQTKGKNNPNYGATVTNKTRTKISNSLRRLYSVSENCPRYGKFGANNPCSKKIRCIELGRDFGGIREAARETGIPSSNISVALKNPERFSAGKRDGKRLHWLYCEE